MFALKGDNCFLFFFSLVDFEEPEDPSTRSFFSEIISSISDVKFSHNGRYLMTRDYLTVKVWDLQMENKPLETYQVSSCHDSDSLKAPKTFLSWRIQQITVRPGSNQNLLISD